MKDVNISIMLSNRKTGFSVPTNVVIQADDMLELKPKNRDKKVKDAIVSGITTIMNQENIVRLTEDGQWD